jgi:hypothetical protein
MYSALAMKHPANGDEVKLTEGVMNLSQMWKLGQQTW